MDPCMDLCIDLCMDPCMDLCMDSDCSKGASPANKKRKSTGDVFVKLIRKCVIAFQKVVQFAFGGNCA